MRTDLYRDIDLSYLPYRAENVSKIDALMAKYASRITCCTLKKKIIEAEALLFTYNSERARMAPLFYGVAKCLRQMVQSATTLKGIAIAIPKEEFCTDDLTNMQSRLLQLSNYFKKKSLVVMASMVVATVTFVMTVVLYIFSTLLLKKFFNAFTPILLFSGLSFLGSSLIVVGSEMVALSFQQRLKCALAEKWVESFIDMGNRLRNAGREGDRYFYDVQKGDFAEVDRAYQITSAICKVNICDDIIDEKFFLPKKFLYQALVR